MHPLQHATVFEICLVVDTLLAERHLLQLHASLASHMSGAGSAAHRWAGWRVTTADGLIKEAFELASAKLDDEDDRIYFAQMERKALHIIQNQ